MRRWIACLLALTLAGCWMSIRPDISTLELVQPAGLPGRYWTVSLEASGSQPGLIEFRRGADSVMISDDGNGSNHDLFRLVRTSVPGVYLKITDYGDNSAAYTLLEHRNLGAWQEFGIVELGKNAFSEPSLSWMRKIANRHGLAIDASDPDETRITGKINGSSIPGLFADPEFLATLQVSPAALYLPAPPAPEEKEELFPEGQPSLPLQIDQTSLPGAEWIAPSGLEGDYLENLSTARFFRQIRLQITRMTDGRFEVRSWDGQSSEGSSRTLGILPLKGSQDEYLAVSFDRWKYEGQSSNYLSLAIIKATETGWSIASILVRGTRTLAGRQDLLSQPMSAAAQRQGASLNGFKLSGIRTAQRLLAVLQDGGFTTGLEVGTYGEEQLVSAR